MKQTLIPILDAGHGKDTSGKRSPKWKDGQQLLEYEFNRNIVDRIAELLRKEGIKYHILVPEIIDISLAERCRRANRLHRQYSKQTFLVSVHGNAGGGTGWEVWTSVGQTKADALATIFYEEVKREFEEQRMRTDFYDGDPDKESQFYILKHTEAPALLTENFFMDTESDCRLMMSEEGRQRIAKAHAEAIKRIVMA